MAAAAVAAEKKAKGAAINAGDALKVVWGLIYDFFIVFIMQILLWLSVTYMLI